MSKLNKDFKHEFDDEFRKTSYGVRKGITLYVVVAVVLIAIFGMVGVGYTRTIGLAQKNAEREVFKKSTTYTEAAASFLAKEYNEYSKATTDVDKRTITQYVILRYPNLDMDDIDNATLKAFYSKCLTN